MPCYVAFHREREYNVRSGYWALMRSCYPNAVRVSLARRQCNLPSLACVFCEEAEKTVIHLMHDCPFARMVSWGSTLSLRVEDVSSSRFQEWLGSLFPSLSEEGKDMVWGILW